MTTVIDLAVADIRPSPLNHRKRFDKLDELGASLLEKGCINPITVRRKPDPKSDAAHELVAGERRWRAAQLVKLPTLPAIVRELSDKEVLEIQLIENVQREDVHPLEEADGYRELLEKHKYSVETIVEKTGKSKAYVYARLKLCDLAAIPRKAFLENKLNPSVALMIARIPDAKLQAQACKEVLGDGSYHDYDDDLEPPRYVVEKHEVLDENKIENGRFERQAMSVRAAQLHLQRKYMLRLEQAPFDIADATLLPKAGACTPCSKRTGNQRELFSDVKSADVCTDPACFDQKKKADWDRKAAAATRSGARVLNDKEAKKVFDPYADGTKLAYNSPYVDPKDKLPYDLDPSQKKTWESVLGKETQVAKALVQDGSGAARELLDKQSALAALKKSGKLKEAKAEAKATKKGPDKYQLEQAKKAREAKRRHEVARLAFAEIEKKVLLVGLEMKVAFWRWLALAAANMMDAEGRKNLIKRRGIEVKSGYGDAEKQLERIVKEAKTSAELLALTAEMMAAYHAVGGVWAGRNFGDNFTGACEVLDVDLKKLMADVVKAEKQKTSAAADRAAKHLSQGGLGASKKKAKR